MGSNKDPEGATEVTVEAGGGSLVATPTKVDPLLPTLAVEAEYIMRTSFVLGK